MLIKKSIFLTFLFFLISSTSWGFNLVTSISSGSGSWNSDWYVTTIGDVVTFSMTPSSGTSPYTYCWKFGDYDGYFNEGAYPKFCHSTSQNPVHTFNYPGEYDVWVEVTDGSSNVEESYIFVRVLPASGMTTYNVSEQTGATFQDKLQAAFNSADPSGKVVVDDGVSCPCALNTAIVITGDIVEFDGNQKAITTTATYWFGLPNGTQARYIWLHDVNMTYTGARVEGVNFGKVIQPPNTYGDITVTVQNSSFTNAYSFTTGLSTGWPTALLLDRNNFHDFGWANHLGGSAAGSALIAQVFRNVFKRNYVDTWDKFVNIFYGTSERDYQWVLENYMRSDATQVASEQHLGLKWYGNCLENPDQTCPPISQRTAFKHRYVRNNIFMDFWTAGVEIAPSGACCYGNTDFDVIGNYFVGGGKGILFEATTDVDDMRIKDNYFWDLNADNCGGPARHSPLELNTGVDYSNAVITNNTDGINTGCCIGCGTHFLLQERTGSISNWTNLTINTNTDDNSRQSWYGTAIYEESVQYYDPGQYLFDKPINHGSYASGGSGGWSGENPRYPYKDTSLVQGVDLATHTFGQVYQYAERDKVVVDGFTSARYRDKDGNWSDPGEFTHKLLP